MGTILLSHSCNDHPLPDKIAGQLDKKGYDILIDPFKLGDRTCEVVQQVIKASDYFILLFTESCLHSRWVKIESRFAKRCYDSNALDILPISVNGATLYSFLEGFISLRWNINDDLKNITDQLSKRIAMRTQRITLKTDKDEAEREKERGRVLERKHAATGSLTELHAAVELYDRAINLDFCNYNAWVNKGWSLWKLGERNRALDSVSFAKLLRPDSKHVLDVQKRIRAGGGEL